MKGDIYIIGISILNEASSYDKFKRHTEQDFIPLSRQLLKERKRNDESCFSINKAESLPSDVKHEKTFQLNDWSGVHFIVLFNKRKKDEHCIKMDGKTWR